MRKKIEDTSPQREETELPVQGYSESVTGYTKGYTYIGTKQVNNKLNTGEDLTCNKQNIERNALSKEQRADAVKGFVEWWAKQELGTSIHLNNVEEYLKEQNI